MRWLLLAGMVSAGAVHAAPDATAIARAAEHSGRAGETALLVWQHGRVVYERRAPGAEPPPRIYSITKSLVSIGVFREVKAGGWSLGQPLAHRAAAGVTLADLLNQTSGLPSAHREFYAEGLQDKAPVLARLRRGARRDFVYGPSHWEVLAEEIQLRRGTGGEAWLRKFVPGAKPAVLARWRRDDHGRVFFSTGARMEARDLLAAGREVLAGLRGNRWPAEVQAALRTGTPANRMYALGFWLNRGASVPGAREIDVESALGTPRGPEFWRDGCLSRRAPADLLAMIGTRGQRVYVVPSRDLVVIRQGEQQGGLAALPAVAEAEGQGESAALVDRAQGGLVVFFENIQRRGVAAEKDHLPIARAEDGERDAGVVLHDGARVVEQEVAHAAEAAFVRQVGGGFEVAGGRPARPEPGEEGGIGFQRAVGHVRLEVDDLGGGQPWGRAEDDAQGGLAAGVHAGFEGAVALQGEPVGPLDAGVGEGQENQHDGKDALEVGRGEVVFHVLGDEVAEVHDDLGRFAQGGEAGCQFFRRERERIGQLADRFESAQGVEPGRGEKGQRADEVGSAEEVSHLRGRADPRDQLGLRPLAHRREVKFVIAEPLRGVFTGVVAVGVGFLQRREGAAGRQLAAGEEGAEFGRGNGAGRERQDEGQHDGESGAFHSRNLGPGAARG